MKTTTLKTLSMAMIIALGVSACSSEKEEAGVDSGKIMAVDRVDAAADLARENGPEAEDMAFPETAPVATTDAGVAADAAVDGMATTEEATTTAGADMPEANNSATTDAPVTDTVENPNANKTAADGVQ